MIGMTMALFLPLFVYTVAAFGLAYIVGHSAISLPFRTWLAGKTFARCPVCGDTTDAKFANGFKCDGVGAIPAGNTGHAPVAFQLVFDAGPVRQFLLVLLECPACCGFWIGVAVVIYAVSIGILLDTPLRHAIVASVVLPLYTCGSNYIL